MAFPDSKIYIVFQPHRYSRTKVCFDEFVIALTNSDKVLLTNIYSAGEKILKSTLIELKQEF